MGKLIKPTLLIGDRQLEMNTSVGVTSEILKFGDERRNLEVDNFLQRHIEIIALAFDATPQEVKDNVPFALLITKFLDCLEYVARIIKEDADNAESILKGRGMKILRAGDYQRKQGRITHKKRISNARFYPQNYDNTN